MTGIINLIIVTISIILIGSLAGWGFYRFWLFPRERKKFLIEEMDKCLETREAIYDKEVIDYCREILQQISDHCPMKTGFKLAYTYADYEIGVNWYPLNGLFEFISHDNFAVIARIHYPG